MTTSLAKEPCLLTISEAAELIRLRKLSPIELTRSMLAQIERLEPRILAWARLCPEEAMKDAEKTEALIRSGCHLGPLHGIPIGVKDVYFTSGLETSAGSPILKGFIPNQDAAALRSLRQAGAILLGKTATTEFACFDPAPTRNPYNLTHTPGGSSSGSAAAVAAHMCQGALGTQTSGSIIRPAAYCGIVGLKPTYDLVSRSGIIPLAWSLDHAGPLTKSVADAGLLLSAIAGNTSSPQPQKPDGATYWWQGQGLPVANCSIGIPDRYFLCGADEPMLNAYSAAIDVLGRLGAKVRQVRLPDMFEAGVAAGRVVMRVEAAAFHWQWFQTRSGEYSPKLRALIEAGTRVPAVAYVRAQQVRRKATEQMCEFFKEVDLLATPATPTAAPAGLDSTGDPVFNAPFTFFGVPSLTIPMATTATGMPQGLQLAAGHFREATLLQLGCAYEKEIVPPSLGLGI
jgi:aspartyl-tRNA(Asn)/glutamyl-tRNA(Gln) amidotransferase subunit A